MEGKHVLSENVALLSATTGRAFSDTPDLSHCLSWATVGPTLLARYEHEKLPDGHALGSGVLWNTCRILSCTGRPRLSEAGDAGVHLGQVGGGGTH